jgi:hypothetical protein
VWEYIFYMGYVICPAWTPTPQFFSEDPVIWVNVDMGIEDVHVPKIWMSFIFEKTFVNFVIFEKWEYIFYMELYGVHCFCAFNWIMIAFDTLLISLF